MVSFVLVNTESFMYTVYRQNVSCVRIMSGRVPGELIDI